GGSGGGAMQAQMRQRMLERFQQDFAGFRASLSDAQRKQWDSAVASLVGATRAPIYKLVDGQPQPVMVRIGASDGTTTEISGSIQAGDEIVTGERAPAAVD
ncbi:MAG: efflux RND transporter periplasmic adaptor subunit, partial [Pseudomonadota bacterium]|nr:efflux RND transporter periplasmic adaptor subunit [Pseudomonadota bacterium]